MSSCFDPVVQLALHHFPDRPTGGLEDDATPYNLGHLGHVGMLDDVEIPLTVVNAARRDIFFWHSVSSRLDNSYETVYYIPKEEHLFIPSGCIWRSYIRMALLAR